MTCCTRYLDNKRSNGEYNRNLYLNKKKKRKKRKRTEIQTGASTTQEKEFFSKEEHIKRKNITTDVDLRKIEDFHFLALCACMDVCMCLGAFKHGFISLNEWYICGKWEFSMPFAFRCIDSMRFRLNSQRLTCLGCFVACLLDTYTYIRCFAGSLSTFFNGPHSHINPASNWLREKKKSQTERLKRKMTVQPTSWSWMGNESFPR